MKDWLMELCGETFMPHGQCYLWVPELIWLHGLSDGLIALAYFSIPLTILFFVRKRRDIPFPWLFLMFGAFIVACGTTHLLEVWTIWNSNYYLTGLVKAFTAAISIATAVALVRIVPEALKLTSPAEFRRLNETLELRVRERTADLETTNNRLREEIAQRQHAEAEVLRLNQLLQRRVEELQSLLDVLPVGVGIASDPLCHDIRMNDALARILGLDRHANASVSAPSAGAVAAKFSVLQGGIKLTPDQLPMQRSAAENRAIIGFEETLLRADGTVLDLLCNAIPLHDASGRVTGCVATFQDVTELKRALNAQARYVAIVASSDDAVIGSTLDGIVTEWSGAAEKIFGYTAAEMVGQPLDRLLSPGHEDESAERLARVTSGNTASPFDAQRARKDGSLVDVSILLSPIRNEAGAIIGFSKIARDITERRRAEQQRRDLDRKIQETQRLESLGVLAGGIAHDFNNLLTGILGNASLATLHLSPASSAIPFLRDIESASCRAAELCSQMLAYACQGRFVTELLDVNRLITETTRLIAISISKTAVLRQNLAGHLPAILADPSQIRQIVMNLVINASEAIGERSGVIAITTGIARIDHDYLVTVRHGGDMPPGDYVFIEISDTGCGMEPATLDRIFDPFFTTKFTGRGLGLAAVLGIVRSHKGGLKVYSEPSRGTTFKLLLPAAPGQITSGEIPAPASTSVKTSAGFVLVVDDEETVRTVAARMLENMGFQVELAADGREAVDLFSRDPSRYHFVLLDLTMPHLNGEETFRQLRHLRPGVRVILMSGFNEQDAVGGFTGKGLAGYIQKPFNSQRFNAAIQDFMRD